MVHSLFENEVTHILQTAKENSLAGMTKKVVANGTSVDVPMPFPSPVDWRDHVIYFLLVDRFNNPDDPRNPLPFEDKTTARQGGMLKGVTAKLDYIKDLGATAIWLSPVLRNTPGSIHGYSIQHFMAVDPRFGSEDDLAVLVDQAHARGMYIILDIVINHAGDVFEYEHLGATAPHRGADEPPYDILWRKEDGSAKGQWKIAPQDISLDDPDLTEGAAIFPDEVRDNRYFRRRGRSGTDEQHGDFETLKEFITEYRLVSNNRLYFPVRDFLIKIHQYLLAKFDVDGFRIDTIKHVERDFSLVFGNAIREFASTIGKKNFLTFGEAKTGDERVLAAYTGRFASDSDDLIGLDSTLDFPLMWQLQSVCKGFSAPQALADLYEYRKALLKGDQDRKVLISSHGEASRFYITFLDNHDEPRRFRHCPKPKDINAAYDYDHQVFLALGCLTGLLGIPCLYYGTEQGLRGDLW